MRLIVIIAVLGLGACTDFPQIAGSIDEDAKSAAFPTLQPLAPLLAMADGTPTQITLTDFDSRIATLRARATRLRGPVIDTATRNRMQRGVAVPAAIR